MAMALKASEYLRSICYSRSCQPKLLHVMSVLLWGGVGTKAVRSREKHHDLASSTPLSWMTAVH
eukprot:3785045-Amphidinium_carterae.1